MQTSKELRICSKGHRYFKSSSCPVCPQCEADRRPVASFYSVLASPARRALESNGITTLKELSKYSEEEILSFHGIGPSAIPKLKTELKKEGLKFRK